MDGSTLGPVRPSERIELLDVLRGFALIGVLYANMHGFGARDVTGPLHTAATFFMESVVDGKFFSLFSLLFGIGFAIQVRRAEERNQSLFRFYWRRLVVLFGLGWAHTLIYAGDILKLYAVLGFVLFLFRTWSPRRLVTVAIIILAAALSANLRGYARYVMSSGIPGLSETTTVEEVQDSPQPDLPDPSVQAAEDRAAARLQAFTEGSVFEVMRINLSWHERWIAIFILYGPSALALFLVGLGILRTGILDDVDAHRPAIRRFMWWMLCLGSLPIVYNTYLVIQDRDPSVLLLLADILHPFGTPALALGYASFITLQLSKPGWHRVLHPLAAVGRVPLSAYVGQSVVYTTIYYGYGLGLYGRLGPAHILPLAAIIFGLEILVCNWWIRRFRFGPLEWLWRSATYLKWQPMKVSVATS